MGTEIIPAPVNPLTLKINSVILGFVLDNFLKKQLPQYTRLTTSGLRTPEHNAEVGGVANSAHVHGLAEDFQLLNHGVKVPEVQARAAWEQFINGAWPGFTEFEGAHGSEGYHVHVQLSREISTYAGLVSLAGLGVLGYTIINKWGRA